MKRSVFVLSSIVILVSLFPASITFAQGQSSVEICHIPEEGDSAIGGIPVGQVITIAQPAYDAHISHGDPESFALLTLPNGREGCSIDSDSDGIPDAVDACPNEGDQGNGVDPNGCPILPPDLSLESYCVPDLAFPRVVISNSGGPMSESAAYNFDLEDGTSQSGDFILGAGESIDLDFSNLHGWLFNFSVSGYPGLNTVVENCLDLVIQQEMFQFLSTGFSDGSLLDPTIPFVSVSDYDMYFEDATFENLTLYSSSISGGFHTVANISHIEIDIFADCPTFNFPIPDCFFAGGDSPGKVYIDSLYFEADWMWDAGLASILVSNETTLITGLTIEMENAWTDFLISIIEPFIVYDAVANLETELDMQFEEILNTSILPLLVE